MAAEDLEAIVDDLEDMDPVDLTEAEMAALRDRLPTDPGRATLLKRALPWPWSETLEYVSESERQPAYWRTKGPKGKTPRSAAEAERNARIAEAGNDRGTVERDGQVIPARSARVAEATEGEQFSDGASEFASKALRRLRGLLGA